MRFRHHPDGLIYIGSLVYPLEQFLIDEPEYSLPDGIIGREYDPLNFHRLFNGTSQLDGGMPWADGDEYLSNEAAYRTAYDSRINALPSLEQAKLKKKVDMLVACRSAIESAVVSDALGENYIYPTTLLDQHNLMGRILEARIFPERTFKFWCASQAGSWARRLHSADQIIEVGDVVLAHVTAQQDKHELKLIQIAAAATVQAVQAISW
jgi:hypothetical protein